MQHYCQLDKFPIMFSAIKSTEQRASRRYVLDTCTLYKHDISLDQFAFPLMYRFGETSLSVFPPLWAPSGCILKYVRFFTELIENLHFQCLLAHARTHTHTYTSASFVFVLFIKPLYGLARANVFHVHRAGRLYRYMRVRRESERNENNVI